MQISLLLFLVVFFVALVIMVTVYFRYLGTIGNHFKRLEYLLEIDAKYSDNMINALLMIAKTKGIDYPEEKNENKEIREKYKTLTDV